MSSENEPGNPANPATQRTGIAVVGAGAVGLCAALALAADGHRVTLFGRPSAPRDGRTVALLTASWRLLARLGAVERLDGKAAPFGTMRLVDETGSLFRQPPVEFHSSELGLDAFGWNVANIDLVEALATLASRAANLTFVEADVESLAPEAGSVLLHTAEGAWRAGLVVGADGRRSAVRDAAGITAREWEYPQVAVTAILIHARDHRDASTEFHTRSGPCTLVPLPGGRRSSLVWLVPPREADMLLALPGDAFALRLEAQVHSFLGAMTLESRRGRVPMAGLSVERFGAKRMVLVGEAAHLFPPIGAQGMNLGLRDVAALRGALAGADDPGADAVIARYERACGPDIRWRTGAVDALNRSLLSDFLPADFLRGAGLLALSRIAPLRRLVMRKGLAGGV